MLTPAQAVSSRCYGCYRPKARCFCEKIPRIDNETRILILQHIRERFHPFNTARMVGKSLRNSQLISDGLSQLAVTLNAMDLTTCGLLYPSPGSRLLSDMEVGERPRQLIVLDGTWHHTKTLVRDIPKLQTLPRYHLAPVAPSQYRIRREPSDACLSTVEATVAALRSLEPNLAGLDDLLAAFDFMIDSQLTLPMSDFGARRIKRRPAGQLGVPKALREHLEKVVLVYGETLPGNEDNTPSYWVAERLVSGERFESAIQPGMLLSETFLKHLELPQCTFENAPSLLEFRTAWQAFLRTSDILAFYYSNIPKLLRSIGGDLLPHIQLKSVRLPAGKSKSLEQRLIALGVQPCPNGMQGRAGKRLASTHALINYLTADLNPS